MTRSVKRPRPPKRVPRSTVPATPPSSAAPPTALPPKASKLPRPPKRHVARIADDPDPSLVDLIDNLLAKGVMLNADLILALADVDLVYVRLSALLCAADRVLPRR
jgi:hypothetical protein